MPNGRYLTLLVFSFKCENPSLFFVLFLYPAPLCIYVCLETRSSQFHCHRCLLLNNNEQRDVLLEDQAYCLCARTRCSIVSGLGPFQIAAKIES